MRKEWQTHLGALERALEDLPQDEAARLRPLVAELARDLESEDHDSARGLLAQLRARVEAFEAAHPTATAIVSDVLHQLQAMGI